MALRRNKTKQIIKVKQEFNQVIRWIEMFEINDFEKFRSLQYYIYIYIMPTKTKFCQSLVQCECDILLSIASYGM